MASGMKEDHELNGNVGKLFSKAAREYVLGEKPANTGGIFVYYDKDIVQGVGSTRHDELRNECVGYMLETKKDKNDSGTEAAFGSVRSPY
ncbi:hypothetical protein COL516b_009726 [Colletotrichum fioriniae]|nr:uncharacterized protein COL516b_009726 [Colletotrichum fioriniae]KAJ0298642.1 hypothetical protein COL516b_009726 [Colletotrichum fioriniae]